MYRVGVVYPSLCSSGDSCPLVREKEHGNIVDPINNIRSDGLGLERLRAGDPQPKFGVSFRHVAAATTHVQLLFFASAEQ